MRQCPIGNKILVAGVVDGRNILRSTDLKRRWPKLANPTGLGGYRAVPTSCSTLHAAVIAGTGDRTWTTRAAQWLAFGQEKGASVVTLASCPCTGTLEE